VSLDIFHGDIKPENILLFGSTGGHNRITAKLTDFSYATVVATGRIFEPKPGTAQWRDPGWHYRSRWSSARAKRADMYSFGLLILWLIQHRHPNSTDFVGQINAKMQQHQILGWTCTLVDTLTVSIHLKKAFKLLFIACFNPSPDSRGRHLDMPSLKDPHLDCENLRATIDWIGTERPCGSGANTQPLELLALFFEQAMLPSKAMEDGFGEGYHSPLRQYAPSLIPDQHHFNVSKLHAPSDPSFADET
jgi:serine/threonine protein kinase